MDCFQTPKKIGLISYLLIYQTLNLFSISQRFPIGSSSSTVQSSSHTLSNALQLQYTLVLPCQEVPVLIDIGTIAYIVPVPFKETFLLELSVVTSNTINKSGFGISRIPYSSS